MTRAPLELSLTGKLLLKVLGVELYDSFSRAIGEVVRNGMVACMPNGWDPKKVHIEVNLYRNHPLSPIDVRTLEVFDRGCGITEERLKIVGEAFDENASSRKHHGANQKRIGRFAAFALNQRCLNYYDVETGFFYLTRTTASGPVTLVPITAGLIERHQVIPRYIDPNGVELGTRRGIEGSFTSVIIPYSVFETEKEIREALEWMMPRKPDLMFSNFSVGGKKMASPPLPTRIVAGQKGDSGVEAYIDKCSDNQDGGVWLADANTGLRICRASALVGVPDPLYRGEVHGDIFVPGLLANQDTSRSGLSHKFLRSQEWKSVIGWMDAVLVRPVNDLLGNNSVFHRKDDASRAVLDIASLFHKKFGKPKEVQPGHGDDFNFFDEGKKPPRINNGVPPIRGGEGGQNNGQKKNRPTAQNKTKAVNRRYIAIKIGDEVWFLTPLAQSKWHFAQIDPLTENTVNLNIKGYSAMPSNREKRQEQMIQQILHAIGNYKFPDDFSSCSGWVNEMRAKLGGCVKLE